MRYTFKGCDRIHYILDTYKYKNTGVGWLVKIGSYTLFSPVLGGLSIRFFQSCSRQLLLVPITDIEINVYGILADWNCEDSGLLGVVGMELEDVGAVVEVGVVDS